jgi:hypothetical protein
MVLENQNIKVTSVENPLWVSLYRDFRDLIDSVNVGFLATEKPCVAGSIPALFAFYYEKLTKMVSN